MIDTTWASPYTWRNGHYCYANCYCRAPRPVPVRPPKPTAFCPDCELELTVRWCSLESAWTTAVCPEHRGGKFREIETQTA